MDRRTDIDALNSIIAVHYNSSLYLTWCKNTTELTDDCCLDIQDERVASLVVHHGNQIFTCAECGKAASRKGDLLRHIVRGVLIQLSSEKVSNRIQNRDFTKKN